MPLNMPVASKLYGVKATIRNIRICIVSVLYCHLLHCIVSVLYCHLLHCIVSVLYCHLLHCIVLYLYSSNQLLCLSDFLVEIFH